MEVWWRNEPTNDFLENLKAFARSLDDYEIVIDLENRKDREYVLIENGDYRLLRAPVAGVFECPVCEGKIFDVMEGVLGAKPALGLACTNCDTYGAVFPDGM